ncbi:hypothetical protein AMTR_s00095p00043050 [Amborella trichopoda]|uniref:Uncharacterized protein n=1 Tax=Amborella trichopoda TaxID=13333 RepID=W1NU02_AMBTC|nr:hypothetical protein AMTR_s00095p00043050 [Amborella trichopoda]
MAELQANGMSESATKPSFTSSASFREGKSRRKTLTRVGSEADDFINLLHGSDPVKVELNRLENEVKDKDRELGEAQAEIKALKLSERLREKAVEELTDELQKVDEKLKAAGALIESKNLEIKKINDEKKASLAAQYAAEATLRRVHAAQKDDEMPPIEAIIAPLEAELRLARLEGAGSPYQVKGAALLEAERTVQVALAKAALVDDLQNKNQELMKQIEICQEENKILDKLHRQKVAEVEKLSQTVRELEEAVLAGGAAANAVRDYQRKFMEMNEEKKILDRELARTKVTANRVAVVVANEWKDANDKVMPVRQWLEERRFLQGEMQQLRDKLAIAERTAKSEAQLKERYHLRLKVLEDGLKASPSGHIRPSEVRSVSNGRSRRQSLGGAENFSRLSSNGLSRRTPASSPSNNISTVLKHAKGSSRSFDGGNRLSEKNKVCLNNGVVPNSSLNTAVEEHRRTENSNTCKENQDVKQSDTSKADADDYVSGLLYDMLQKEVIALRKASHEKDQSLKDKDDAIEMLAKKVDTLTKAMEVEAKKMRREVATMEKEVAAMRVGKGHDLRTKRLSNSKVTSQLVPGRYALNGKPIKR